MQSYMDVSVNDPNMVKCNSEMKCDEQTLCCMRNRNVSETCFYRPVNEAKWSSASALNLIEARAIKAMPGYLLELFRSQ